jgi:hypothetical protein
VIDNIFVKRTIMIVLNSLTKRDVTTDYLKLMAGEITRKEFAETAGIKDIKKISSTNNKR